MWSGSTHTDKFSELALVSCSSWMDLVYEWVRTCQQSKLTANDGAIKFFQEKISLESLKEKEGLPSPPLDDGALLAGRTISLEMSQVGQVSPLLGFDFLDDDLSEFPCGAAAWSSPHSSNLSDDFATNLVLEAKKQRTVLAIDFADLPKAGPKSARPLQAHHVKPGRTGVG
ncbi:hypothetical protein R1sor_003273 [Riccia sorocarpa]|uniref:Uncharacterized protein n=1 Tax=Riccia sorocarpa TaxID=122646 RepID=A0ABD3H2S5_9MARC